MGIASLANKRALINNQYLGNEQQTIKELLAVLQNYDAEAVHKKADSLVSIIRKQKHNQSLVEAFLHEYQLNSKEGIVLLSIAEAILRIPDSATQDLFIQEKLTEADWYKHLQHSDSSWVNLSTQALLITSKLENQFKPVSDHRQVFDNVLTRLGLPLIRKAIQQAMQYLAHQFVIAETIEQATYQAHQQSVYLYSFDMLGEAALTAHDTERYFEAYAKAIKVLAAFGKQDDLYSGPGISIKLSALCPRYEPLQHQRAVKELSSKLLYLVGKARQAGITVTVDAEETERLEMSLDIFEHVFSSPELDDWPGFGLAVQAYQKRAFRVVEWLAGLAESQQRKIPCRLVKGAYWDSEIKRTQENGLGNYPVFTHKTATDVSFLACAKPLLDKPEYFYPQFATHNAHTVAAILELGKNHPGFEFQRLYGMGEQLHNETLKQNNRTIPCRIYAPVGVYQDLLPYLVRRLLENGANTSFINQVENATISVEQVISDPVLKLRQSVPALGSTIVLPKNIYGHWVNSHGLNICDPKVLAQLKENLQQLAERHWQAFPLINGQAVTGTERQVVSPHDQQAIVGSVVHSDQNAISKAIDNAYQAFSEWRLSSVSERTKYLLTAADLLEENRLELVSLCIREAGRTIKDALAEVREAVDFCRYYASSANELFDQPEKLPGPTGEDNKLQYYGRGVFLCISPWNFPIAIFLGQITAALAAGNTVIAKPAELTSLTAYRCIEILYQAGIPKQVLQFLPGEGGLIGTHLLSDERIAGVAFTGSIATAKLINQQLAQLPAIVPLIAETGGQNVMIADSSAHTEQLVQDIVQSAFNSAGQRCSALRVLFIPHQVADKTITMIIGAMQQLVIGKPDEYGSDIGPVICCAAVQPLLDHVKRITQEGDLLFQSILEKSLAKGCYFTPTLLEINALNQLTHEVFGPILHVIRYHASDLDKVIEDINATGYGLTLGIHSRINTTINKIKNNVRVGNVYVNRNMIGAVVGVQPFGGMGLSGTGPKAGGPNYLQRFVVEQTISTNTAAVGGNALLMAQDLF
jgi:RHH-type proline utilization regulon transcriptional repressor/proline dehydrogenase/delta 1-pyrroline-5-carboxylate dehydrogenase